jgi:hypothetical protein
MKTGKGSLSLLADLLRAGPGIAATASMLGGMLVTLSACGGGGWPMTVEQRYSEPKTQEQILQEKVDAAQRAKLAHGAF